VRSPLGRDVMSAMGGSCHSPQYCSPMSQRQPGPPLNGFGSKAANEIGEDVARLDLFRRTSGLTVVCEYSDRKRQFGQGFRARHQAAKRAIGIAIVTTSPVSCQS
jgi:hypothetical protein